MMITEAKAVFYNYRKAGLGTMLIGFAFRLYPNGDWKAITHDGYTLVVNRTWCFEKNLRRCIEALKINWRRECDKGKHGERAGR